MRVPGLHPRGRDVRRLGREAAAGLGTSLPEEVAAAIVRAVERNRAEIDVAPLPVRAGTRVAGVAPVLAASVSKRFGSSIARAMERGRREQR